MTGHALDAFRSIDDAAGTALAGSALAGAGSRSAGPTSFYADMRPVGNEDFRVIIAVLLGAIFVVLALLLRSVVAPFYLLATVDAVLPGDHGRGRGGVPGDRERGTGISFWLPPFLFVILVALGADYNIFIMSRIREEAEAGYEIHEAAARGLVLTGHVITSAGLILAGTFAALMLAPLPNMRQIGFAVTFGVLIDTFVVRSLLVPSATMLLGKWAFWPSVPVPAGSSCRAGATTPPRDRRHGHRRPDHAPPCGGPHPHRRRTGQRRASRDSTCTSESRMKRSQRFCHKTG